MHNVYKDAVRWAAALEELFKFDDGAGTPLIRLMKFDRRDFKDIKRQLGDATDRLAAVLTDEVTS